MYREGNVNSYIKGKFNILTDGDNHFKGNIMESRGRMIRRH